MFKRDEIADPDSCLNKAYDDELIFVILERDQAAIPTVRAWITTRIALGLNQPDDDKVRSAERWIKQAGG